MSSVSECDTLKLFQTQKKQMNDYLLQNHFDFHTSSILKLKTHQLPGISHKLQVKYPTLDMKPIFTVITR